MGRWRPFAQWLVRTGRMCVRVLEQGKLGGRWHFHCITWQRWDVTEVRPFAERWGFGRINVKRIPSHVAGYVAKYVGKDTADMSRGAVNVRRWACIGFHGVSVRNIRITVKLDLAGLAPIEGLCVMWRWTFEGYPDTLEFLLRTDGPPTEPHHTKIMELKTHQQKELLADLAAGHCVIIGEYRGHSVRSLKIADRKSGAQVERVVVEHNVEINGVARTVAEWLPVGSDAKAAKVPAQKGDLVKVLVESAKWFGGSLSYGGQIKSLTQIV